MKKRKKLKRYQRKIISKFNNMSDQNLLDNIKKLRELTGVGFKDCKVALDETKGDIEKSIEFLRKRRNC